jgi:SAM-dependent methyltransferase
MTDGPARYGHLDFNAPLSSVRADALAAALARYRPARVLDVGCGWAELLLRVLAAAPECSGIGWDTDEILLARARADAATRRLDRRVRFVSADPGEPADLLLCVGSDHVFGTQVEALRALHERLAPDGVALVGTGYWRAPPTDEQAAALGAVPGDFGSLADLVDAALAAGWRLLDLQTANEDEWNAFESGYLADGEQWLRRFPDHRDAGDVRARADRHRTEWLSGYRDVLAFAYLTLGRASAPSPSA